MSTNTTLTVRLDGGLKRQAETICEEMGLNMSSAITIFLKRLVKERAIPFRVSADDHFYSQENINHLRAAAARMDVGKYVVHELHEDYDV